MPTMAAGPTDRKCLTNFVPSPAIAENAKHENEQIDKVEIKLECAHYGLATRHRSVLHRVIHFLNPLGIPGGHAGKNQHSGHRDHEVELHAFEKDVDYNCN